LTKTNRRQWRGIVHALRYSPGDDVDIETRSDREAPVTVLGRGRLYGDPAPVGRILVLAADPPPAAGLRAGHRDPAPPPAAPAGRRASGPPPRRLDPPSAGEWGGARGRR